MPKAKEILTKGVCALKPEGVIAQEIGMMLGHSIVDLMILNDCIHTVEIKGERDNLSRLNKQVAKMSLVSKYVEVWFDECFQFKIWGTDFPGHVGIVKFTHDGGHKVIREAQANPIRSAGAILSMLWKVDLVAIAKERGLMPKSFRGTKEDLVRLMCDEFTANEAESYVVNRYKSRADILDKNDKLRSLTDNK